MPVPNDHILCVEAYSDLLESRCAVLKQAGYFVDSALSRAAEILLASHPLDLVVVSNLTDYELNRIVNVLDGADILVLKGLTQPAELLFKVDERLHSLSGYPGIKARKIIDMAKPGPA